MSHKQMYMETQAELKNSKPYGTLTFPGMTLKLMKEDPMKYDCAKAVVWVNALKMGIMPTKWLRPTYQGTKYEFKLIDSSDEYADARVELWQYLIQTNTKHGTDFSLK